ncbi:hypothetical protein BKG83_16090 [Mycobacteroides chelonae]|nr:hypothetical protein BKG83_16090 [Mycobacteroides chelonae]
MAVDTAYLKAPIPQPWIVTDTGPLGNDVAVHTDHLYAYAREHYTFWAHELGRDIAEWPDGFFAENLTFDNLNEGALHIGDEIDLGDVRMVVTGPRVPCFKLTWRLGQPKTFMRTFRTSGKTGVYLSVIRPGTLHPGDEIEIAACHADHPTVRDVARMCDDESVSESFLEELESVLRLPTLSSTVARTLNAKASAVRDKLDVLANPGWSKERPFRIRQIIEESPDISSFILEPSDEGGIAPFQPGQHLSVKLDVPSGRAITRNWSLSEYGVAHDTYRITVRRIPGGQGSARLFEVGQASGTVRLRRPSGSFTLAPASWRPSVFVCTGIGVTPIVAMTQAHVARKDPPPLYILFGARSEQEAPLLKDLQAAARQSTNVKLTLFLSRDYNETSNCPQYQVIRTGRINASAVVEELRDNHVNVDGRLFPLPWFETDIYLCGSPDFSRDLYQGLVSLGANPDLIKSEQFKSADPNSLNHLYNADAIVHFGDTPVLWSAEERQTLLELGEEANIALNYDCRAGTCGTCEYDVTVGSIDGLFTQTQDGRLRAKLCSTFPASAEVTVAMPGYAARIDLAPDGRQPDAGQQQCL